MKNSIIKKYYWIISVLFSVIINHMSCGSKSNDEKEEVAMDKLKIEQTLINMEEAALERWRQGDPDGYLEIIAEDYTYFDPNINSRVNNYESIKDNYDNLRGKINFDSFDIISPVSQIHGNIGVLTFNFKSYGKLSDGTAGERTHWHTTEVFKKYNGNWKLISTHWSFTKRQLEKLAKISAFTGESVPVKVIPYENPTGEAVNAIYKAQKESFDKWKNGDLSGFLELMSENCTYLDPGLNQQLYGIQEIKGYNDVIRSKIKVDSYEIKDLRIQLDNDIAVVTYNLDTRSNDGDWSQWHCTDIYLSLNNTWKIISSHWAYTFSMLVHLGETGALISEKE